MLLYLDIINGEMSLKFDKYVNNYTVKVLENVNELIINCQVEEGFIVNVVNNENLVEGLNYVYIEVSNEEKNNVYVLEVYKEGMKSVFENVEDYLEVEVREELPDYVIYTIIGSCLFLILIFFHLIFHKRKGK